MRSLALTLSILGISAAVAWAGPESLPTSSSGKEVKEVVPMTAPPCCTWGGFYAGIFSGYKYSNVDVNMDLGGDWNTFPDDRDEVESFGNQDLNNSGAELGGILGYNFQWRCWVFGLEAAGGYLWARDSNDSGTFTPPTLLDKQVSSSFQTHYLFTFAPRIGYSFGRWLPYVTGGLAVGDLEFDQSIKSPGSTFREDGSQTDTNLGWMVGGGLQVCLTRHWSVRGQYQYIDLGDVSFNTEGNDVPTTGHHEASLTEHNVSFALIYGF